MLSPAILIAIGLVEKCRFALASHLDGVLNPFCIQVCVATFGNAEMLKVGILMLAGMAAANVAHAQQSVHFVGDFETGAVQRHGDGRDGFFIKTLPNPQGLIGEIMITAGGAGPDSNLDTRVVSSESVGGELVKPRKGSYFLRSAIYFDKNYDGFSGSGGVNKPRTSISIFKEGELFDYDVEGYTGFSIYLPKNLENETGTRGQMGKNQLMSVAAPGAADAFSLNYWVPSLKEGGGNDAHWWINLNHSTTSTDVYDFEYIDLGTVVPDKGKWTDFVIRWRANPFTVDTNPYKAGIPNAKDKLYRGNRGILQVWKAQGAVDSNGNRKMVLVLDRVNSPVGQVPHKDWKLRHHFRQYKHHWHRAPTSVKGPVWIGFDEIRFGLVARDTTAYSDVHASALACTDSCPGGTPSSPPAVAEIPPAPPESLKVLQ